MLSVRARIFTQALRIDLRILGFIRELKHSNSSMRHWRLTSLGSLFLGHTVVLLNISGKAFSRFQKAHVQKLLTCALLRDKRVGKRLFCTVIYFSYNDVKRKRINLTLAL